VIERPFAEFMTGSGLHVPPALTKDPSIADLPPLSIATHEIRIVDAQDRPRILLSARDGTPTILLLGDGAESRTLRYKAVERLKTLDGIALDTRPPGYPVGKDHARPGNVAKSLSGHGS
jgi:hypothetical protein